MAITPIDLQKTTFRRRLAGYDSAEVDQLLTLAADELTAHLAEIEKLERENRYYRQRLQESQQREGQLQETLLHLQKVSDQMRANAEQESQLILQEAQQRAQQIVHRAMEEAAATESHIAQLKTARRELYHRFRQTIDFFERVLDAESEREDGAQVRTLAPRTASESRSEAG